MAADMKDTIVQTLLDKLNGSVIGIYLYGSQVSGYATQESDWDIAVLLKDKLQRVVTWDIAQVLARFLNRDVDLVDLLQASTVMQYEIITRGKRIYTQDKVKCEAFENQVASMYLRFNEERRDILLDVQARGQVY